MDLKSKVAISYAGSNLESGITMGHAHRGTELLFVQSGECQLSKDGKQVLTGTPGTLFVIPPNTFHRRQNLIESQTYYVVFEIESGEFDLTFRTIDMRGDWMMPRWFCDLARLEREDDADLSAAMLLTILLRITHYETRDGRMQHLPLSVKKALDYIAEHNDMALSVQELTQIVGCSQSHLNFLFRNSVGIGVKRYLENCQMQLARRLLRVPYNNIGEVAYRCGFSNPHYFSRRFREFHGLTPSSYRKLPPNRSDIFF